MHYKVFSPELGTCGSFWYFNIEFTYFFQTYVLPVTYSAPVLFKKPTPSQINLI